MLAVGLDRATLFVQSRVPAHAQLAYLLECVATSGELNRMIQFKEKGRGIDSTRAEPTAKMGKSNDRGPGVILLLDPPDVVRRKVSRAVTDSETGPDVVRADRTTKPGVTNLLDILAACGGAAAGITTYGALKKAVTDAVVETLRPVQKRYADLAADPAYVTEVFAAGAARCREVTAPVLAAAEAAIGL